MAKKREYQKLASSRLGLAGIGSLWLGPDHLLLVSHTTAVERYRRWYLRDFQCLIARRNSARLIWNIVFGGAAFFCGSGAAACWFGALQNPGSVDYNVLIVFAIILGLPSLGAFILMLINSLLGPGCTVYLQTPSGLEKLSLPGRLGAFRKLVDRLDRSIQETQRQPATPAP